MTLWYCPFATKSVRLLVPACWRTHQTPCLCSPLSARAFKTEALQQSQQQSCHTITQMTVDNSIIVTEYYYSFWNILLSNWPWRPSLPILVRTSPSFLEVSMWRQRWHVTWSTVFTWMGWDISYPFNIFACFRLLSCNVDLNYLTVSPSCLLALWIIVCLLFAETFHMIDTCDSSIAGWSEDDGETFIVKDPLKFERTIIPQFFKHSKFSSFVRVRRSNWYNDSCIDFC